MASNEPTGDNRRIGAVRPRPPPPGPPPGPPARPPRNKTDGKFIAVKKSKKKFKGVRKEKRAA